MFPFTKTQRLALGPTRPPIEWVPELKRPGLEVNYSPVSDTEVRNECSYATTAGVSLHGLERGNFISQRRCPLGTLSCREKSLRFDLSSLRRSDLCWGPPIHLFSGYPSVKRPELSMMMRMAGAVPPLLHMSSCPAQRQLYLYLVENTLHDRCEDQSFSCVHLGFSYSRFTVKLLSHPLVGRLIGHIPNGFPC